MTTRHSIPLEDVLDALMLQESEPSYTALMRWCDQYPEHRDELARFFATWAVQKELPEKTTVDETRVGTCMVSHALNILHRQDATRSSDSEAAIVPRLCAAIVASGLTEEEFADQCSLDESIVAKLDRRLIRFASIPCTCLERIGTMLCCGGKVIERMLSGNPVALGAYKARGRPALKVEDFLDAVEASSLSDAAKREWRRIATAERQDEPE